MSRYKRYLVLASLLFLFTGCSFSKELDTKPLNPVKFKTIPSKEFVFENEYIIFALEYENQKDFYSARKLYRELFLKTNRHEYLLRALSISFLLKDYKNVEKEASKNLIENTKDYEAILRLYIYAQLKSNKKNEALKNLNILLASYKNAANYELQGSIYVSLKDYEKAYTAFKKAYFLSKSLNAFLSFTNLGFFQLKKQEESKMLLENHIRKKGLNYNIALQLISFYNKDKENKKILKLLEEMYSFYKEINAINHFENTKKLLVGHLINTNINKAIEFLEKDGSFEKALLSLYHRVNAKQKAYKLLAKLYKKTSNLDYLAQMAILEYEMAKDKKTVLKQVSSKFDKVVNKLNNAVYNNYYAYLLIDYDLNINKGLVLVKKALKKEPKNAAYLDTLAWGEYKNNNCKEAYNVMQEVVKLIGLEEQEIKEHWDKIKECK